jgi:branched-chain amino acid transport system substrate-binding protein
MLDAAMLGLFDKYAMPNVTYNTRITLLPKDAGNSAKSAKKAANAALEEGASLILGPLHRAAVEAVVPIAKARGVTTVSFSNHPAVANAHSLLFGFLPQEQVVRVCEFAMQSGKARIAALLPDDAYGVMLEEGLHECGLRQGVQHTIVVKYPPNTKEYTPYIQRIRALASGSKAGEKPSSTLAIDALLLAEGGERVEQLVTQLKKFELGNTNITYLGTGLWDNPALRGNPDLVGSMFASSPMTSYQGFIARFEHEYGYTPPRLASLGYDAVAFAATVADIGGFTSEVMMRQNGFSGPANGIFRFHQNGSIERKLSVLTITPPASRSYPPHHALSWKIAVRAKGIVSVMMISDNLCTSCLYCCIVRTCFLA